ncbi:MAG: serine hydrolase domain-containing protein [Bacteroidota bacterium]
MQKITFLFFLLPSFLVAQSIDLRQIDQQTITIEPGDTLQYHLDIQKDELAFMRFEQKGADIVIHIKDPSGRMLMEFDGGTGANGPELVQIIPSKTGPYQVVVFPYEDQKKPGQFSFAIEKVVKKAPQLTGQIDQYVSYWADQNLIPGFGIALVTKDSILMQKAYGYADLESKKPYTLETIQNIGSVSKTLIGLSLMKAVKDGKLQLDDPAGQYLPFEMKNPYFPNEAITIRQLANHTSSIQEMDTYEKTYILKEPFPYKKGEISKGEYKEMQYYMKNKNRSMGDFLKALLDPSGDLYKKSNYRKEPPGTQYSYSNCGATVAAYIIELLYEMPYSQFTKQYILEPLDMNDTGWSYETIDANKHSTLYFLNHKPIPKYSIITYPDGGLLTNVKDLSKYLQAAMKGHADGQGLVPEQAYQEMMAPSLSAIQQERKSRNYGVFWEQRGPHIGHNGGDPGIVCFLRFNTETGIGKILMVNMIPNTPLSNEMFGAVWGVLSEFGDVIGRRQ